MAGVSWLAELASQSVCSRKLRGLFVWRTTSELCVVRSRRGASHCGLRSGGACSAGAARSGQRTGSAESAAPGGTALHQGTEARARAIEERRELNRVAGGRATDQFCRLGGDRAGSASGPGVAGYFRFSRRPAERDRTGPKRSGTRPEERRDRSQWLDAATGVAFAGADARQELGLSRIAGADRRRLYAAAVHGLPLPAGAAA